MKRLKYIIVLSGLFIISSCKKTIENTFVNPNHPTTVPAGLILEALLTNMSDDLVGNGPWDIVMLYNQYWCKNYAYYGSNEYGFSGRGTFDPYTNALKNVVQMEAEAKKGGAETVNPYEAIGRFLKAYYYYEMTMMAGDIPLTDALQGASNPTPTYTSQKDVFKYVLNILDTANTEMASMISAGNSELAYGDIYYSNDLSNWQKLINTFKLRVLIQLSSQSTDADLNAPQQFAAILNDHSKYPIFESSDDDLQFKYISSNLNPYPLNPGQYSDGKNQNMAQTYVQNITTLKDARVFMTCDPAWAIVDSLNVAPTDYRVFAGGNTGIAEGTIRTLSAGGYLSFPNWKRYYDGYVGEPNVIVGYKEMCFNIAEAINRGWVSGDVETWYKTGIQESMKFYGLNPAQTSFTAYFLQPGNGLGNYTSYPFTFDFNAYYNQAAVKYASGATGLNQILLQKYLAFFQNSGWEAYFNYRRTGVPAFQSGVGIGNNGKIPLRLSYPTGEQTYNQTNWQAALQAQGFTTDDINGTIWLLK